MMNKDFDCVEWVRDIRNREFNMNKHLSLKEYTEKMSREVHESDFFRKAIVDRGVEVVSPSLAKQ